MSRKRAMCQPSFEIPRSYKRGPTSALGGKQCIVIYLLTRLLVKEMQLWLYSQNLPPSLFILLSSPFSFSQTQNFRVRRDWWLNHSAPVAVYFLLCFHFVSPPVHASCTLPLCSRLLWDPWSLQGRQRQDAALLGWTAGLRQPWGPIRVCAWCVLSRAWLFATPRTAARQASVSIRVECPCWSGLPFPPPRDLSSPGIELTSPALAGGWFTTEPPEKHKGLGHVIIWGSGPSHPKGPTWLHGPLSVLAHENETRCSVSIE